MKKQSLLLLLTLTVFYNGLAQNSATILTDWMALHCRLVRQTKGIEHVAYSRHFCYTAIAAYESIVKSDATYCSLTGQLQDMPNLPQPSKGKLYWPASLNAAYAAMLRHFYDSFPSCKTAVDSMSAAEVKS